MLHGEKSESSNIKVDSVWVYQGLLRFKVGERRRLFSKADNAVEHEGINSPGETNTTFDSAFFLGYMFQMLKVQEQKPTDCKMVMG